MVRPTSRRQVFCSRAQVTLSVQQHQPYVDDSYWYADGVGGYRRPKFGGCSWLSMRQRRSPLICGGCIRQRACSFKDVFGSLYLAAE